MTLAQLVDNLAALYLCGCHLTVKTACALAERRLLSGKTAARWIDESVILEAKALLKYSGMSIQEIAYHLNFSTQSFFGKYFKSHTGMTPSAYRIGR